MSKQELLNSHSPPAGPESLRSEVRHACRLKVLYKSDLDQTWCGDTWVIATVVDISRNGLALVTRRKYSPGTIIAVTLLTAGSPNERQLFARVANVARESGSAWRAGCELAEPLHEDDFQSLLQHCGAG